MNKLSITTASNEAVAFVRREAGLLAPVALAFVALPTAFVQAMMPLTSPGQEREAGAWMLLIIPLAIATSIGTLAITILALGRETVVGSALSLAARRVWPLLGAAIVLGMAGVALMTSLIVIFVLAGSIGSSFAVLLIVGLTPLFLFLWVRLMLMTPVAAAEPIGPIALIRRSWNLTSGHTLQLLGLVAALALVVVVVALAVSTVFGILITLTAGRPEPNSLSYFLLLLLGALLNAVFLMYFATLLARLYAQLVTSARDVA